jgi:hypothetical protein
MDTITLSKLIVLDDNEAVHLNLTDLHRYCAIELFEKIGWYHGEYKNSLNVGVGDLTRLEGYLKRFESKFYSILKHRQIFTANSLYSIPLKETLIRIISFDLESKELKLAIHAISNDVKLVTTIGSNIVVNVNNEGELDSLNTITLAFGGDLSIIKVKR